MKIIKLSQSCVVSRQVDSIIGWEDKTVYEPVYINANHIESFAYTGITYIKMTSGEQIKVSESPEEILALINRKGNEQHICPGCGGAGWSGSCEKCIPY